MPDFQVLLEQRRQLTFADQDMRRAMERATDTARTMVTALASFQSAAEVDLDVLTAGIADLREAKLACLAAMKKRAELKAALGEA